MKNTLIQARNIPPGVCCALVRPVLCAQMCGWMGAVSAFTSPKPKVDSDVEAIRYLCLEHQWLRRQAAGQGGMGRVGGSSVLAVLFSPGWCVVLRRRVQKRRFVSLLLRKVSHGLALLLVVGKDAWVKLNKDFRSQQEKLGCFSSG